MGNIKQQAAALYHVKQMDQKYLDKIKNSVDFSKIYTNNSEFDQNKQKTENTVNQIIERLDSVSAVKKYSRFGKVAVLNFASFKHPGGGFINGSMAQEEALCHESTLYNVIADDTFRQFYNYNKQHLNRGMYHNRAIYSPNIAFTEGVNDEIVAYADVITCACPNYSYYIKMKVSPSENLLTLKSRIEFVKKILVENDVQIAILGAYGCGVFGQDPVTVASIFKETFSTKTNNLLEKIIYAIPGGPNYKMFCRVFGR